ncbi:MAG: hypothetical protein H0X45_05130 [Planctomycetes bacterium]|nr:hypothetical protein [Planctomycetota bacterium]
MSATPSVDDIAAALSQIARVATALIDGDEARRIITDRAYWYAADPYPTHIYLAGDYMDFDLARHDRMKKFLIRLGTLAPVRCDAGLWVWVKGAEHLATIACHNGELHRWYRFGENSRALEPEMVACRRGEAVVARPTATIPFVTVLAPVRDSLGDVIGCVELTAADPAVPAEKLPAWS